MIVKFKGKQVKILSIRHYSESFDSTVEEAIYTHNEQLLNGDELYELTDICQESGLLHELTFLTKIVIKLTQ